jgi:hypothetical protein
LSNSARRGFSRARSSIAGLDEPGSLREPGAFAAWAGLVGCFFLVFLAITQRRRRLLAAADLLRQAGPA